MRVGDKVQVHPGLIEPHYGWGGVNYDRSQVGVVTAIREECVVVKFPTHTFWKGKWDELKIVKVQLENK